MERNTTKISFNLDNDLLGGIERLMRQQRRLSQTAAINQLIAEGLAARETLERAKRREDYVLLKTLYILRYLASSRGPEVLPEIDQRFQSDLEGLKDLIFKEGMDYGS